MNWHVVFVFLGVLRTCLLDTAEESPLIHHLKKRQIAQRLGPIPYTSRDRNDRLPYQADNGATVTDVGGQDTGNAAANRDYQGGYSSYAGQGQTFEDWVSSADDQGRAVYRTQAGGGSSQTGSSSSSSSSSSSGRELDRGHSRGGVDQGGDRGTDHGSRDRPYYAYQPPTSTNPRLPSQTRVAGNTRYSLTHQPVSGGGTLDSSRGSTRDSRDRTYSYPFSGGRSRGAHSAGTGDQSGGFASSGGSRSSGSVSGSVAGSASRSTSGTAETASSLTGHEVSVAGDEEAVVQVLPSQQPALSPQRSRQEHQELLRQRREERERLIQQREQQRQRRLLEQQQQQQERTAAAAAAARQRPAYTGSTPLVNAGSSQQSRPVYTGQQQPRPVYTGQQQPNPAYTGQQQPNPAYTGQQQPRPVYIGQQQPRPVTSGQQQGRPVYWGGQTFSSGRAQPGSAGTLQVQPVYGGSQQQSFYNSGYNQGGGDTDGYDDECPNTGIRIQINGIPCEQAVEHYGSYLCYRHEYTSRECCAKCRGLKNAARVGCEYGDHSGRCQQLQSYDCYDLRNRQSCCESCERMQTPGARAGCEYGDMTPNCERVRANPGLCYIPENRFLCCDTCSNIRTTQDPDCPWGDQNADLCAPFDQAGNVRINCYASPIKRICCQSCERLKEWIPIEAPGCEYGDRPVTFNTGTHRALNCTSFMRYFGYEQCTLNQAVSTNCCYTCHRYTSWDN